MWCGVADLSLQPSTLPYLALSFSTRHPRLKGDLTCRYTFPKKTAALELTTYAYPKNCPASSVGGFVERHKLRDKNVIGHHVKLIVRPKAVQEIFVHFLISVENGWQEKLRVRQEAAFLKHIVWIPPFYANCRAYVYEDTGLAPGE